MKAAIFDMDGVIVDTNPFHLKAWKQYAVRYNLPLDEADFISNVFGRTNSDTIAYLFTGKTLTPEEVTRLGEEKEQLFRDIFQDYLTPVPGLMDLLKSLKENGILTAIATSAPTSNLQYIVDALGLEPYFDAMLDATAVTVGKPNPEIYRKAIAALNVRPEESVVFEDSLSGIKAGKGAGAFVVGLSTTHRPEELAEADAVIPDFRNLTVARLAEWSRKRLVGS